ncbi:MAG: hypothetical protein QGG02_05255 [Gammaproteobacteria bacterium]|nr:hypothetical protein [Gammaproteobacteria bacterium]MDP6733210.1 hypothetical protein [Gammaproteobacteria bacterium]
MIDNALKVHPGALLSVCTLLLGFTVTARARVDARIEWVEQHPADSWTDYPLQERAQ